MIKTKTALIVTAFNRPEYLARCFESLELMVPKPDIILVVDDCSNDIEATAVIERYTFHSFGILSMKNHINLGIRGSLLRAIDWVVTQKEYYYIINLDGDAIVKPDFISKLRQLHYEIGAHENIVSGFNCFNETNQPIRIGEYWEVKPFCNGINMCFNEIQYHRYIRPALLKKGNWDYNTSLSCQADNLPFIITKPSVVQHIGLISSMGHTANGIKADTAHDF